MTLDDLRNVSRFVDTEIVTAGTMEELYGKFNSQFRPDWTLMRNPFYVGETIVAILWRPRKDWS
jgi:hypothetical protein